MTEGSYGSVWSIDHCYPLSKTNLSNGTDKIKTTSWINLRPMYSNKIISKGFKIDHHMYLFQEVKGKSFLKLHDQEGLNQNS